MQTALQTKLTVDWRAGVAATDWDTIAKKEHLDQLSVEMRKVEGQIREIYAEMLQLQQREQEMRDLNGKQRPPAHTHTQGGGGFMRARTQQTWENRPGRAFGSVDIDIDSNLGLSCAAGLHGRHSSLCLHEALAC